MTGKNESKLPNCEMAAWAKEVMGIINEATADIVYSQINSKAEVGCLVEAREKLAHAILAVDALLLIHGKGMCQQGFSWRSGGDEHHVKSTTS